MLYSILLEYIIYGEGMNKRQLKRICKRHLWDYFEDYLGKDIKEYGKAFYHTMLKEKLLYSEHYFIKTHLEEKLMRVLDKEDREIKHLRNYTLTIAKNELRDYISKWNTKFNPIGDKKKKEMIKIRYILSKDDENEDLLYYYNEEYKREVMTPIEVIELLREKLTDKQLEVVLYRLKRKTEEDPTYTDEEIGEIVGLKTDSVRKVVNRSYNIIKKEIYGE
jgi:DNA-directed RNA polymerase specialized sigma24 family protein